MRCAVLLACLASSAAADWTWSIEQARARARREELPMLVYSVESRLVCGPLEHDAPRSDEFRKLAAHFVLAKVRAGEAPREYGMGRGRSIVAVVDLHGRPAERLVQPPRLEPILAAMRRQAERARLVRAQRIAYVESFGPQRPERTREIELLVRALGSEEPMERVAAARRLLAHGEAAYGRVTHRAPADTEARARALGLARQLGSIRDGILRRGLHRDPLWLSLHVPRRLERILPAGAFDEEPVAWFARNRRVFRWDPGGDRFVAWRPWTNAALRLRGRGGIALPGTRGALDLARPFTIEAWVRWGARSTSPMICIAGDEAWRGMSPRVRAEGTSGWVLRRHRQGGGDLLDFTVGVRPSSWFQVLAAPHRGEDDWTHVAVVRDASAIRLYHNGEELARRACAGARFRASPSRIFLGVREHGWHDRVSDHDLRGFHITQRAKYDRPFLPAQRLEPDARTVVHYAFRGTEGALRDTTGRARHAAARPWVRTIAGDRLEVFEAERGTWSAQWFVRDHDPCSDGRRIEVGTIRDPADGHWVEVPFHVRERGRYRLLFAGPGLHRLGRACSPFLWRVDGAAYAPARPDVALPGGADGLGELARLDLQPGPHRFSLRLARPRTSPDERWSLWFDALVLQRLPQHVR